MAVWKCLVFNKNGEKDVGPSVYTLLEVFLHLQKNSVPMLAQKKNQPINKQQLGLHVEEFKSDLKSPYILRRLRNIKPRANELQGFQIVQETPSCI